MSGPREEMTSGRWYRDHPDLVEARRRCARLLERFNTAGADDDQRRATVLRELLGSIDPTATVMSRFTCAYGDQITIGAHVLVNYDCLLMDDLTTRPENLRSDAAVLGHQATLTHPHASLGGCGRCTNRTRQEGSSNHRRAAAREEQRRVVSNGERARQRQAQPGLSPQPTGRHERAPRRRRRAGHPAANADGCLSARPCAGLWEGPSSGPMTDGSECPVPR